ncbi:MAG: sulfate adenylyltransferase [Acidimicrobiales bacterium mtb01]|nr:sulfate adenylyltransferase [Actinomycetota bacterium]TEX47839.1 MAG: sulfate adenylyltransferase [Acidimicrobiales bacterium mtb01]
MVLRIATAGSVDDGKSTLIGRLLHDTKTVFEDQLRAVERASLRYGDGSTNLALLTDGLRAEREQGITIDVAYRFFGTPRRTFVVADTPGHAQYTRNMVTGASVSDVAIVLVDARVGPSEQTKRHLFICSLLGVQRVVVAVNKMDLVDWSRTVFDDIVAEVTEHIGLLPYPLEVDSIPLSALLGENVVDRGSMMPWYEGPSLLEHLEDIEPRRSEASGARLAVQYVIRPHGVEHHDYRGFAGRLFGGSLAVGDEVTVLPGGRTSKISALSRAGVDVFEAQAGQSIAVQLVDDIDVGRGDVIVPSSPALPLVADEFLADISWMSESVLSEGSRWTIKHNSRTLRAIVTSVRHRYDVLGGSVAPTDRLELNDLGVVSIATTAPLVWEPYDRRRSGGAAILMDEATGMTVGAIMLRDRISS